MGKYIYNDNEFFIQIATYLDEKTGLEMFVCACDSLRYTTHICTKEHDQVGNIEFADKRCFFDYSDLQNKVDYKGLSVLECAKKIIESSQCDFRTQHVEWQIPSVRK